MMASPAGSEGITPHAREEAPASNRWIEQDDTKEADGGIGEMMKEVADLRQELKDREEVESTRIAEAKGRLASANERAAMLFDDLVEQESKEERRFETWTQVTEDLQEMNARRQRGEAAYPHGQSPQVLPGDGWGGMTENLDTEMARITSLVDAAGPSPSSVVVELEARQACLAKEECGSSNELERQIQKLVASERREGFEEGVGGSATTTTPTNTSTNANEQSTNTNTNTTTDINTPTNTNHQSPNTNDQSATANDQPPITNDQPPNTNDQSATTNDQSTTTNDQSITTNDQSSTTNDRSANTNDQSAATNDQSATTNDQSANLNTSTNEQSTTVTPSPSVGVLREEKRHLCKRLKKYNELTEQLLEFIDGRQADTDENIRRTEEALLACNARRKVLRVAIKGAIKKTAAVSARVKEIQLAQAKRHIPPVNSITEEIASWEEEEFYYAFIERVRAAGGDSEEKNVFIAEEILCEEANWYVRRQLIGEGGFGRVDMVSAFTPREYFALKTLKTDMEEGSEEGDPLLLKTCREGLMAEMAVHCRLPAHTNIAQAKAMDDRSPTKLEILYELGECDFTKYTWGNSRTSLCEIMGHLVGVAAGLMFLHEHNIGHNDLKPENILLFKGKPGKGYTVKLADFGLALAFGDLRKGHGSLGITPPEAILEKVMPCRPDQDVFAVGHLILLIVTKRRYKNYNMFLSRAVAPKDFDLQMTKLDDAGRCRLMEKSTLRRMVTPDYRRRLFDPSHISDKLGELKGQVLGMVDLMTSVDPSRRPSMKTVAAFVARIHQRLLEDKASPAAGPPPAAAVEEGGAAPEQSAPPKRSGLGGSYAVSADLPSVEVLPAEETGDGSDGRSGSAGGPSVPVVTPANRERGLCQSEVGTVAVETARLLEDVIDGAGASAPAAGAVAPAAVAVAAAAAAALPAAAAAVAPGAASAAASPTAPTTADPEQSAPPARSSLGGNNDVSTGLLSVEILPAEETGDGSDGGGGPTVGPSVPVAAPANREGGSSRSEVGTVTGVTVRLPEGIIDGAPGLAAAGGAVAAADIAVVTAAAAAAAAPLTAPSAAASAPAAADPEQSAPPARSALGDSNAVPADLPSVEVLSAEETGDGIDGGGGLTGGPSVPVVTPANREGDIGQSEVGTVAGKTACLPEVTIGGAAALAAAAGPAASIAASLPSGFSAAASAPATAAAAAGVTRSINDGDGSGEGRGDGDDDGVGDAASLAKLPSAATSATAAQEVPGCVSVKELAATGECDCQASAPGLVGSACVVPSRTPNAIAATEETGVVPTARVGSAPDVCDSGSRSVSPVAAGAPVQASQATVAVSGRDGAIVPSAVDGGGAAHQAPCEGARRAVQSIIEHNRQRGKGIEWLLHGVCKGARQAPCRKARRSAQNTTGHKGKRGKGAEWLLQDVCKANPAALPQKVAGAVAGGSSGVGSVNYAAPSRVNAREVQTTPQVAASPPPPSGVHGSFSIAHIVRAAVARLVPSPRREGGGAAAPPSTPEPQAPPPSQAALGWAGWGVFPRCGDVPSVRGRAGEGLDSGSRASAGRVAGVPAARAKTRQPAGPWQAGAVHGPSYGGLAPHAYAPCGGYGGWTAPKHQWTFVACGAPGYHP